MDNTRWKEDNKKAWEMAVPRCKSQQYNDMIRGTFKSNVIRQRTLTHTVSFLALMDGPPLCTVGILPLTLKHNEALGKWMRDKERNTLGQDFSNWGLGPNRWVTSLFQLGSNSAAIIVNMERWDTRMGGGMCC